MYQKKVVFLPYTLSDIEKRGGNPYVLKLDGFPIFLMKQTTSILLIGLFVLSACTSAGEVVVPPTTTTASPQPTATEARYCPHLCPQPDGCLWGSPGGDDERVQPAI
jgi:hypothetical protein